MSGLRVNFSLSFSILHKSLHRKSLFLSVKYMFWSLFILRGHATREPASIFCNNEQVTIFFFCDPTQELVLATTTTGKSWERF